MFAMEVSDVIATLKEQIIPRGQENGKALHVLLDLRMHLYEDDLEVSRSAFVHFLLHCPHGGSTHTFMADGEPYAKLSDLHWENTSNHDSCWRSDGLRTPLSNIYFDMARQINGTPGLSKSYAPKDMQQVAWFHFSKPWELLDNIQVKRNSDDRYKFDLIFPEG